MRGYGSLLMLNELMKRVMKKELEESRPGGPYKSSFAPYESGPADVQARSETSSVSDAPTASRATRMVDEQIASLEQAKASTSRNEPADHTEPKSEAKCDVRTGYLPCHYFDYICGTSTGG